MAKGKKTGGKDFVPGDPRAGRPPMPADLKKANALTTAELKRVMNAMLFMDDRDIDVVLACNSSNQLERMIANIIKQANKNGDNVRLDFLLNRLVGKVTEKVEVKLPEPFIVTKRDGSQIVMGAKMPKEEE